MVTAEYLDYSVREEIVDLMDGDKGMIIDLIESLIESSPALLKELAEGISTGNGEKVKHAAHALKSSNAQLGAKYFAQLCLQMENLGKRNDFSRVGEVYDEMKEEFDKVSTALNAWKKDLEIK